MIRRAGLALLTLALFPTWGACSSDSSTGRSSGRDGSVDMDAAGSNGGRDAGTEGGTNAPTSLLPDFRSGTRLHVRQYQSGDMPPVLVSMHDSELERDCTFYPYADGSLRCIPDGRQGGFREELVFADAACTQGVVTVTGECTNDSPYYVWSDAAADACAPALHHVAALTQLAVNAPLYVNDMGTCVEQGFVTVGTTYLRIGDELPASSFVLGTEQVEPGPGRLGLRRIVGDDGSYTTLSVNDAEAAAMCRLFPLGDDLLCIAGYVFHGETFRTKNDSCTESLTLSYPCGTPRVVVRPRGALPLELFAAGPEYAGTVYQSQGGCMPVATPGRVFELGAPLEASSLPLVRSVEAGSGRLRAQHLLDESGNVLRTDSALYDSTLKEACSPSALPNGDIVCLPNSVPRESTNNLYFADAACTEQLAACGEAGCPQDVAVQESPDACGRLTIEKVLSVGDVFSGDQLYIFYSGREPGMECDGPFETDGYGTLRRVAGEGSAAAFAKLTEVIE
jgi:hypothetical protein